MSEPLRPSFQEREISVLLDSSHGGKPTLRDLFSETQRRGLDIIQPLTRSYFIEEGRVDLETCVFEPLEFQLTDKGEDRIFCGRIGDFPITIVADGVSAAETPEGQIITGGGGKTAEETVLSTIKTFSEGLRHGLEPREMYFLLENVFEKAVEDLGGKDIKAGTTLLIALLYRHLPQPGSKPLDLWYYAYVGDGTISLISPKRKIDELPLVTNLLTPQKVEHTAAVSAKGLGVLPIIGSIMHTSGDILYSGSDGLAYITGELRRKKQSPLPWIIYDQVMKSRSGSGGSLRGGTMERISDRIKAGLGEDYIKNTIDDDIVLGVMSTHGR